MRDYTTDKRNAEKWVKMIRSATCWITRGRDELYGSATSVVAHRTKSGHASVRITLNNGRTVVWRVCHSFARLVQNQYAFSVIADRVERDRIAQRSAF
jgi:hypothetical protein